MLGDNGSTSARAGSTLRGEPVRTLAAGQLGYTRGVVKMASTKAQEQPSSARHSQALERYEAAPRGTLAEGHEPKVSESLRS